MSFRMFMVGVVGAIVVGLVFWLALFGVVQSKRSAPLTVAPGVGLPGVAVAPVPGISAPAGASQATLPAQSGPSEPLQVRVVAFDLKFDLKEIKAQAGQQVELTLENRGAVEHDFVLHNPEFRVVAGPGQTATGTFTAPKAGSYEFICSIPGHKEAGMVGKLTVTGGEAAQSASSGQAAPRMPMPANVVRLPVPKIAAPVNRTSPTTVKAEVEIKEVQGLLDDGVAYSYWTFGGTVPGPMLRVRQGDQVELTLKNAPDSLIVHSIDLHAVTGPGGGAKVTQVGPGEQASFRFQALKPGVYVYHCATPMVAHHIANGMYGLIVVEPPEGLTPVDHEFYVMQGDFYTQGGIGEKGLQDFSVEKMLAEHPDYVVFNGAVGAISQENALKAKVGDSVRLFFGVGGPNLTSSFHIIGEIFDRVYMEGASEPMTNIQTTLVPAGGAAIVEFKVEVPGTYILADHSLGRLQKGGAGFLEVEGPANPDVFQPIQVGRGVSGH